MNQTVFSLKATARDQLLGKYQVPVSATILAFLIVAVCTTPFVQMVTRAVADASVREMLTGLLGILVVALVDALFAAGITNLHLQLARGKKTGFADFLYPFKHHPDKFIGLAVLIYLISVVCMLPGSVIMGLTSEVPAQAVEGMNGSVGDAVSVLASASSASLPGLLVSLIGFIVQLILMLGLSLSLLVLLEDPYQRRVIGSMKTSWQMMKGQKGRLFILMLSFIGWVILGIISFGIGMIWVTQYMEQTLVQFYQERLGQISTQDEA